MPIVTHNLIRVTQFYLYSFLCLPNKTKMGNIVSRRKKEIERTHLHKYKTKQGNLYKLWNNINSLSATTRTIMLYENMYRVATVYLPHIKYTEQSVYIELVCFTLEYNSANSIPLNVGAICISQNIKSVLSFTSRVYQHLGCHRSNCNVHSRKKFKQTSGGNIWSFA